MVRKPGVQVIDKLQATKGYTQGGYNGYSVRSGGVLWLQDIYTRHLFN